jgi:hypothetical protein
MHARDDLWVDADAFSGDSREGRNLRDEAPLAVVDEAVALPLEPERAEANLDGIGQHPLEDHRGFIEPHCDLRESGREVFAAVGKPHVESRTVGDVAPCPQRRLGVFEGLCVLPRRPPANAHCHRHVRELRGEQVDYGRRNSGAAVKIARAVGLRGAVQRHRELPVQVVGLEVRRRFPPP